MAVTSDIEWTESTLNPTLGCTKVSPGCDNCYAIPQSHMRASNPNEKIADAFAGLTHRDDDGALDWTGQINMIPERLDHVLAWRRPRRIFVNSMSDLFHDGITDEFIARTFALMAAAPQHTFQILTKRHGRMRSLLSSGDFRRLAKDKYQEMLMAGLLKGRGLPIVINAFPPKNVWLGVSVENQKYANLRIPALLDTPAAVRWISCEPLLGPVDLTKWTDTPPVCGCGQAPDGAPGAAGCSPSCMLPEPSGIDWLVAGGESGRGPNIRPMHPEWARSLRDQCAAASIPFLFKQWGEWGPAPWVIRVCDPAVGWTGTDEELAAAKADAEARGATHVYASWAHEYGHDLYEPPHKPWSLERVEPIDPHQAPMRRWGKKRAGRELDGKTWDQYPRTREGTGRG
jgi:protein gp37